MIELININHQYETRKEKFVSLKDINLKVFSGETIGIVGVSGAGKSTLIRLINGLITPTSGQVMVNQKDINKLSPQELSELRQEMGMIFQNYNLLSQSTVAENIKLALIIANYEKTKINQRITEVLELVGLTSKKNNYPSELSGGEKQRVGIARAIASKPKYLLCDEATAALDPKTALEIVELLKDIVSKLGITVIFISHQLEIVMRLCQRLVVIDQGMIVEDTTVLKAFTKPSSKLTKELIQTIVSKDLTNDNNIYELIYTENTKDETLISNMIKKFQVDVSITHAKMLELIDSTIGYLYITVTGVNEHEAINYLRAANLQVNKYE